MYPLLFADPIQDAAAFLATATAHPAFHADGVLGGAGRQCQWFVVDPDRHPLHVWRRRPGVSSYAGTAVDLGAAVFSNGPMMGRRLPGVGKLTRSRVGLLLAGGTAVGTVGGIAAAGAARSADVAVPARSGAAALLGAVAGVAAGYAAGFTRWVPCGGVRGAAAGIEDGRDFDGEGTRHAWFGRRDRAFASYAIGDGDLPSDVAEGMGGLIALVRDHRVVDGPPGHPAHRRDFEELSDKPGVVAWGLAPVGGSAGGGVLMVFGGRRLTAAQAAQALQAVGARDAVATDQSGSVLLGSGEQLRLPRPTPPRQSMQTYGLYCR
jgi:hypothetical protein